MTTINVTEKNTKAELFGAVQQLKSELAAAKAAAFNPAADAQEKKVAAVKEKAEVTVKADVSTQLNAIGDSVTKLLADAAEKILKSNDDYKSVTEAIELKKQELADLYEIDKALLDLAALVNTQNDLKAKFAAQDQERIDATKARLAELNDEIATKTVEFNAKIKADQAALAETRKKEQEEFDYNLKRSRKIDADNWADEKARREKEFQASLDEQQAVVDSKDAAVKAREDAVAVRETKIDELEEKVASIPAQIDAAVSAAVAAKEKSLQASFAIEKSYLKKEADAAATLAQTKLDNVNERLEAANLTIADLQGKLNAAYAEIKDLAAKTVESAGNARQIASLEQLIGNKTTSAK